MRQRLVGVLLLLAALTAPVVSQAQSSDGFLAVRRNVIEAYGAAPIPEVTRLYYEYSQKAKASASEGFMYRRAVFAELAGLAGEEENALLDILKARLGGGEVAQFCVELMRSRGTLAANTSVIVQALEGLSDEDRVAVVRALAHACMWSKPPAEVLSAVRTAAGKAADIPDLVQLSAALASWGYRDDAAEILYKAASADRREEEIATLGDTLNQIGERARSRRLADEFYSRRRPPDAAPGATLTELRAEREGAFESAVALAGLTASWDKLIDRVAVRGKGGDQALVDYAVVLEGAGLYSERAEALRRLYDERRNTEAAALYGNALIEAGDAYLTQNTLVTSLLANPSSDQDPYLDLFDAVSVLRDPQLFLQSASLLAGLNEAPQVARTMSEYARVLGDFKVSDRLFASFIVASGLGTDTRFNWEGSRLLANYYLDTGRLDDGVAAADRALGQLLDVQGKKEMTRSAQPQKFVAMFERFGRVDKMLDYCRGREKDLPKSMLLSLLEEEALSNLGQWDEAWKITARAVAKEPEAMRDVFTADSRARAGRLDEAIALYEKAVAADSRVPARVQWDLVDLYARTAKWDSALKLFEKDLKAPNAAALVAEGQFFSGHGQDIYAAQAFGRLDDITIDVDPKEAAAAVRYFAQRDPGRAADLLSRRLMLQTTFWDKYGYLDECLPQKAAACPSYLSIGAALEKSPLATDHQLLGVFYRLLSIRAERIREYGAAYAAAKAACFHDPGAIENAQQLLRLVSGVRDGEAEGVARAAYSDAPLPSILLKLTAAQFALKRASEAERNLSELASTPLSAAESHRLVSLVGDYAVKADDIRRIRDAATSAWSWTLRARLADAALAAADAEGAVKDAHAVVEGGTYVGRALWAADFYVRAGKPADAGTVIALFKASSNEHPALVVAEADMARLSGNAAGTATIISATQKHVSRPQFAALLRMEAARVASPPAGGPAGERK